MKIITLLDDGTTIIDITSGFLPMGHFYSVYHSIVCLVSALIRKSHRSSGPTGRDKILALRRDKDLNLVFLFIYI